MTAPSAADPPVFICPACDTLHRSKNDVANRYCAICHWPTGDPMMAWARPELFTERGKPAPTLPGLPPNIPGEPRRHANAALLDEEPPHVP